MYYVKLNNYSVARKKTFFLWTWKRPNSSETETKVNDRLDEQILSQKYFILRHQVKSSSMKPILYQMERHTMVRNIKINKKKYKETDEPNENNVITVITFCSR